MGLVKWAKRRAAIKRITHKSDSYETLRNETGDTYYIPPKRWARIIDGAYDDDQLHRIDSYLKHSADYYPRLALDLRNVGDNSPSDSPLPDAVNVHLGWIEVLTPIYKRVEADFENNLEQGHWNTVGKSTQVIDAMIRFLLHSETTPEQQYALMSITYLRLQHMEKEAFTPFTSHRPHQTSLDEWVTVQAMSRPYEVRQVFDDYLNRRRRHNLLALKLRTTSGQLSDQVCDFPDDLIEQIRNISDLDKEGLDETVRWKLKEGEGENAIRDMILFAPLMSMHPRISVRLILNLRAYDELPRYECYSQAPQHVRDQCTALLVAADALVHHSNYEGPKRVQNYRIADRKLARLLLDHPERAERIASIIRERNTSDVDLINDATSSAVSEGFL